MIFNSLTYLAFLGLVVAAYWALPRPARLAMLLGASIVFYGFWRFDFVALLFVSILVDYFAARAIHASGRPGRRRALLVASLTVNLGLLALFKYHYFLSENLNGIARGLTGAEPFPYLELVLPIGISFYTFQSMSYTLDVYRGFIRPTREFLLFANYVIFFPQLIAGPILRAGEVIWQLDRRPAFRRDDLAAGLVRITGGLFLKVVLADNIAPFVDDGFAGGAATLSAIDVVTLGFLFGFQIYFDFAGYSHIALGSARLMGIRFPENFRFPYLAQSPREFWRRWHITLSAWIRDYLYLPLAGAAVQDRSTGGIGVAEARRAGRARALAALFATWAIMGLWHGAAWAFVIWGLWHAALVASHRLARPLADRLPARLAAACGWAVTLPLVMVGWIPFRAQSLDVTAAMLGRLADPSAWTWLGMRENAHLVAALVMAGVLLAPMARAALARLDPGAPLAAGALRFAGLTAAIALTVIYLRPIEQFIYFQF